jgi:hypothetical protein
LSVTQYHGWKKVELSYDFSSEQFRDKSATSVLIFVGMDSADKKFWVSWRGVEQALAVELTDRSGVEYGAWS